MNPIYKICTAAEWQELLAAGRFRGSPDDRRDGFIHLSDATTVRTTAEKHFAGREGLMLLAVDAAHLGKDLRRETSRGGVVFPHLYADLSREAVIEAVPLPLGPDGLHRFPVGIPP